MSAPTVDPANRPITEISTPDQYARGCRVWVYSSGSWRPGIVLGSSSKAAIVRYRPTESRGTAVDTVLAHNLARRDDADPYVDQLAPGLPDPEGVVPPRLSA